MGVMVKLLDFRSEVHGFIVGKFAQFGGFGRWVFDREDFGRRLCHPREVFVFFIEDL